MSSDPSPATRAELQAEQLADQLADLGWLRALAGKLTRDPHRADDAVQETCALALRQARVASQPPTAPRAWLATVLRNLLGRQRRSEQARERREAAVAGGAGTADDGPTLLQRAETQHRLAAAVLQLDEPYRSAVLLRFFDGLPPRRIAQRLGVPIATVHSRLQRALQQLRASLDRSPGGRAQWLAALAPFAAPGALLPWTGLSVLTMQLHFKLLTAALLLAGSIPFWWPSAAASETVPLPANAATRKVGGDSGSSGGHRGGGTLANSSGPVERSAVAPAASEPRAEAPSFSVTGRAIDDRGAGVGDLLLAPNGQRDRAVRTDAVGNFALELAGATTSIAACDEHYVTVFGATWTPEAKIAPVVVVARAVTVQGRVVDELGAAVAEAQVMLQLPADFDTRFPMPLDRGEYGRWHTTSRADGSFDMPQLPCIDGATLLCTAEVFAPTTVPLPAVDTKGLQIVLQRFHYEGGELAGRVVDPGGAPVAGARVAMGVTSVVTDHDGRFGLSLRRAGWPTAITAAKAGYGPARCEVPSNGGKQLVDWPHELVLRLGTAPQSVRGRVHDQDGQPIAGAEVWIDDPTPFGIAGQVPLQLEYLIGGGVIPRGASKPVPAADDPTTGEHATTQMSKVKASSAGWLFVTTDGNGSFELPGLLDRTYTLKALDPASGRVGEVAGVTGSSYQQIEISGREVWPELRGRVVSRRGKPIAGVTVQQLVTAFATEARVPGGHSRIGTLRDGRVATTDADGIFVLRDVGKRSCYFDIAGDPIVPRRLEVADIADPLQCTVTVEARCHLEVALLDPNEADAVMGLDATGKQIELAVLRTNSASFSSQLPLHKGRSGLFVVPESAAKLVLLRGDVRGREIPISPDPDRTTTVQ